jgi:hypothetical protein
MPGGYVVRDANGQARSARPLGDYRTLPMISRSTLRVGINLDRPPRQSEHGAGTFERFSVYLRLRGGHFSPRRRVYEPAAISRAEILSVDSARRKMPWPALASQPGQGLIVPSPAFRCEAGVARLARREARAAALPRFVFAAGVWFLGGASWCPHRHAKAAGCAQTRC